MTRVLKDLAHVMDFNPENLFMMSGWTLYALIFLTPFIQEDAAVIGAATASISGAGVPLLIFATVLAGLTASDVWKYWLGWAARRYEWAHKFAEKPGVSVAGKLVDEELVKTLFTARFVPGTRIPTYLACGFFLTPYLRFVLWVMGTATLYVTVMFVLFHAVGEVAGERAKVWLPIIAVVCLGGYILFRYLRHRADKSLGPMTPLTTQGDDDMTPDYDVDAIEPDEKVHTPMLEPHKTDDDDAGRH
ncbi:MAG: hypothetical protein AAFR69_07405 [Pseudomonadota bacterium]